jgi:hypothetical protein
VENYRFWGGFAAEAGANLSPHPEEVAERPSRKVKARLSQWDRSSFETPLTRLLEDGATPELPEGFVIDVKSAHWDQPRDIVGSPEFRGACRTYPADANGQVGAKQSRG